MGLAPMQEVLMKSSGVTRAGGVGLRPRRLAESITTTMCDTLMSLSIVRAGEMILKARGQRRYQAGTIGSQQSGGERVRSG